MARDQGQRSFKGRVAEQEVLIVAYRQGCILAPYLDLKTFQEEALPFHQEVHQEELQEEVALDSRHLVRLEGFAAASQLQQSP